MSKPFAESPDERRILSVREINEEISAAVQHAFPATVWVRGEIQRLPDDAARRTHVYFELHETGGSGAASNITASPVIGDRFGALAREISPLRPGLEAGSAPEPDTVTIQESAAEGDLLTVDVVVHDLDDGVAGGEFAIGFNPYVLKPMKDILFDEKIAGSLHFTPGRAYDDADNGNRSEIHWDLVLIQRPEYGGGEITFDGSPASAAHWTASGPVRSRPDRTTTSPPPSRRAQKFPEAASFRMALSSACSPTSFLSRAFSFSSSFRRRAWSTFMPPYSLRQR